MKTADEMLTGKWAPEDRGYPSSCWIWQKGKTTAGYGETWDGEHVRYAHRVAYEVEHGPLGSLTIHHLCEQRDCINPAHMEAHERWEHNGGAGHGKLLPADVHEIRRLLSEGSSNRSLAARFGVAPSLISLIKTGKRWAHV